MNIIRLQTLCGCMKEVYFEGEVFPAYFNVEMKTPDRTPRVNGEPAGLMTIKKRQFKFQRLVGRSQHLAFYLEVPES